MQGHLPPFFDRFDPETPNLLDNDQLMESVQQEFIRLINAHRNEQLFHPLCSPAFRKPFSVNIDIANPYTWKAWAKEAEQWLLKLDPRLSSLCIQVQNFCPQYQTLHIQVQGTVRGGQTMDQFLFTTQVSAP